jgi:hypothetical protein
MDMRWQSFDGRLVHAAIIRGPGRDFRRVIGT